MVNNKIRLAETNFGLNGGYFIGFKYEFYKKQNEDRKNCDSGSSKQ